MFNLPRRVARTAGVIVALGVTMTPVAIGCGLDWRLPHVGPFADSHFDEQGHVLYAEEIGKLRLGEGESYEEIPLYIKFSSKPQPPSPYLGAGWMLPLLDSRIVQLNEREFLAEMPNGWTRVFYRTSPDSSILQEGSGWKGEIKDDLISVWADCGWKLVFKKGQLVSITTPKNHRLDYQFRDGAVKEVKERNKTVFEVERDRASNEVMGLVYGNDQQIGIELGDKPQVQSLNGQNMVGTIAKSLGKLNLADGTEQTYKYAVNEEVMPALTISRFEKDVYKIAWNPANFQIVAENDWKYSISFPEEQNANARIERFSDDGRREYWYFDALRAKEFVMSEDRRQLIKEWFYSGKFQGLIRKIDEINGADVKPVLRVSYDEFGQIIRRKEQSSSGGVREIYNTKYSADQKMVEQQTNDGVIKIDYDKNGNILAIKKNGNPIWIFSREGGKVTSIKSNDDA